MRHSFSRNNHESTRLKRAVGKIVLWIVLMMVIPCSAFIEGKSGTGHGGLLGQGNAELPSNYRDHTITVYLHTEDQTQEMLMSDYIKGVVIAEMPATFEAEALKAQAVLAHTYTLRIMSNEQKKPTESLKGGLISTDPAKHQAYLSEQQAKERFGDNYITYQQKISDCVDAVINKVLTYNDQPIIAAFHAISSGNTENAKNVWGSEVPYLIKIESVGDELAPSFENTLTLTVKEVQTILQKKYPDMKLSDQKEDWFTNPTYTPSGYVSSIQVLSQSVTGQEIRSLFQLKSAHFTIGFQDDKFIFQTKGYGHGVGMSQYGADYMARQNKTYEEILAHYYPNTQLSEI